MYILIDAYNLIKQITHGKKIPIRDMIGIMNQLNYYAKIKEHKLFLVFDGYPHYDIMDYKINFSCTKIIWSGSNQTADDWIKDCLQKKDIKIMLLVSSDRDLIKFAEDYNVVSIEALFFWSFVVRVLKKKLVPDKNPEINKSCSSSNDSVDAIMYEFSLEITFDKDDTSYQDFNNNDFSNKQFSKRQKRLYTIIKKI